MEDDIEAGFALPACCLFLLSASSLRCKGSGLQILLLLFESLQSVPGKPSSPKQQASIPQSSPSLLKRNLELITGHRVIETPKLQATGFSGCHSKLGRKTLRCNHAITYGPLQVAL